MGIYFGILRCVFDDKTIEREKKLKFKDGSPFSFKASFESYSVHAFLQKLKIVSPKMPLNSFDCYSLVDLYLQKFIAQQNVLEISESEKAERFQTEFLAPVRLVVNVYCYVDQNERFIYSEFKDKKLKSLTDASARQAHFNYWTMSSV